MGWTKRDEFLRVLAQNPNGLRVETMVKRLKTTRSGVRNFQKHLNAAGRHISLSNGMVIDLDAQKGAPVTAVEDTAPTTAAEEKDNASTASASSRKNGSGQKLLDALKEHGPLSVAEAAKWTGFEKSKIHTLAYSSKR